MPQYRVKITRLGTHKNTQGLVKFLLQIPGLSSDRIMQGLQRPPLELPPVPMEQKAQQLTDALARFGAICVIEHMREAPVAAQKQKDEWLDGNHLLHNTASGPPPTPASTPIEILSPPLSTHVPGPLPPPHNAKDALAKKQKLQILLVLIGVLVLIAPPLYIASQQKDQLKSSTTSTTLAGGYKPAELSDRSTTRSAKPQPAGKSQKPGQQQQYDLARKQQDMSEQLKERAKKSDNPQESSKLLQQSVQYNPYDANAWSELEKQMNAAGDAEGAAAAHKAYEHAMKVHNTLQGIAKAFGTEPKVAVSTSSIVYTTTAEMDDQSFYEKVAGMYDELVGNHPEKEVVVENRSGKHVQTMHIVPGEPYPDAVVSGTITAE